MDDSVFSKLLRELRDIIWELVVTEVGPIAFNTVHHVPCIRAGFIRNEPAITKTCKQLYNETFSLYYKCNTFIFHCGCDIRDDTFSNRLHDLQFWISRTPERATHISELGVTFCQETSERRLSPSRPRVGPGRITTFLSTLDALGLVNKIHVTHEACRGPIWRAIEERITLASIVLGSDYDRNGMNEACSALNRGKMRSIILTAERDLRSMAEDSCDDTFRVAEVRRALRACDLILMVLRRHGLL